MHALKAAVRAAQQDPTSHYHLDSKWQLTETTDSVTVNPAKLSVAELRQACNQLRINMRGASAADGGQAISSGEADVCARRHQGCNDHKDL